MILNDIRIKNNNMKFYVWIIFSIILILTAYYFILFPIEVNRILTTKFGGQPRISKVRLRNLEGQPKRLEGQPRGLEGQPKSLEGQQRSLNESENFTEWNETIFKYIKLPLRNDYGSHSIVLLAALYASKLGPILELGMGTASSPLLHSVALDQGRFILSADSDRRWINHFSPFTMNNTLHELKYVEVKTQMGIEWATSNLEDYRNWSIVFIDHRPGSRRQFDLMSYSYRSHVVIVHDTESSSLYQYDRGLSVYRYQYRFTKLRPHTDALSTKNQTLIMTIRRLLESIPDNYFSTVN